MKPENSFNVINWLYSERPWFDSQKSLCVLPCHHVQTSLWSTQPPTKRVPGVKEFCLWHRALTLLDTEFKYPSWSIPPFSSGFFYAVVLNSAQVQFELHHKPSYSFVKFTTPLLQSWSHTRNQSISSSAFLFVIEQNV